MNKKRIFILSLLLSVFVLGIIVAMFKVETVVVKDLNKSYTKVDFDKYLKGNSIFMLNPSKKEQKIKKCGLIEEIRISKVFPKKVIVEVLWKEPVIAMKTAGKFAYLSNDGFVLGLEAKNDNIDTIEGVIVKSAIIGNTIHTENNEQTIAGVNLIRIINDNKSIVKDDGFQSNVKIINGNLVQVINDKYWINFGDGKDIKEKFKKAIAIYNFNVDKGVTTGIINVSIDDHAIYEAWK